MSKTTDALDWAFRQGRREGIRLREATTFETLGTNEPQAVDFSGPEFDPADLPSTPDTPIVVETARGSEEPDESSAYDLGFNAGIELAYEEIVAHFDELVSIYHRAADTGDDGEGENDAKDQVLDAIARRADEVKR